MNNVHFANATITMNSRTVAIIDHLGVWDYKISPIIAGCDYCNYFN